MTDQSTNMTPEWVAKVLKDFPFTILENGNLRTCPVRLSFPNLFKRSKPVPPNTEGKYGANLIIPIGADLTLLSQEAGNCARAKWPAIGTPQAPKLKNPIKPQGEMLKYEGYIDGGFFITPIGDRQPPVVDQRMAPITDENRVYPGVWAICAIRPFAYDKGVNKGVSFGLQSVMIIADDKNLGGGGGNPAQDFAGVNISSDVNPAAAFGTGATAGQTGAAPAVDIFA